MRTSPHIRYNWSSKPARASNTQLMRWVATPFNWSTEWIEAARERVKNLPQSIQDVMDNIDARMKDINTNPTKTLKAIDRVRRMIGQASSDQAKYNSQLWELDTVRDKLISNTK